MWMFMKSFQYNLYKGKYYWGRLSLKSSVSNANWNQLLLGVWYTSFHGRKTVVLLGCVFLREFLPLFRQGWEGKTVVLVCILLLPSWHQPWGAAPSRVTSWNSNFGQRDSAACHPVPKPSLATQHRVFAERALGLLVWICPGTSWVAVHIEALCWLVRRYFWNAKWCLHYYVLIALITNKINKGK